MDTYFIKSENEAMLKHLIDQLSKELYNGEGFHATEDGAYSLQFESGLNLSIKENLPHGFCLFASVAAAPELNKEPFLVKIMSANLLGKETGEAVLGLSNDGKQVILTHHLSPDTHYKGFREAVEDFINYLESWRQEIEQMTNTAKRS